MISTPNLLPQKAWAQKIEPENTQSRMLGYTRKFPPNLMFYAQRGVEI